MITICADSSGIVLDLLNIAVPALFLVLLVRKRETVQIFPLEGPRWVVAPFIGLWLIAAILHAT